MRPPIPGKRVIVPVTVGSPLPQVGAYGVQEARLPHPQRQLDDLAMDCQGRAAEVRTLVARLSAAINVTT